MKTKFAIFLSVLALTACGGGGGGGGGGSSSGGGDNGSGTSGLSIVYTDAPLEPDHFNPNPSNNRTNREYEVGENMDLGWQIRTLEKNGEEYAGEARYQGRVYLSEDETIDEGEDALLIDADCDFPDTGFQYACGRYAGLRCKYNDNATATCISFADEDTTYPYGERTEDISAFLDVAPKAGY